MFLYNIVLQECFLVIDVQNFAIKRTGQHCDRVPALFVSITNAIMQHLIDKFTLSSKNKLFEANADTDEWSRIHTRNFKCTVETQLKSFYFKVLHKAIATNDFLSKIGRSDTSLCSLCNRHKDSIQHFLVYCERVTPIWSSLERYLNSNLKETLNLLDFEKLFGVNQSQPRSSCINFFCSAQNCSYIAVNFKRFNPLSIHCFLSLMWNKKPSITLL